MTLETRYARSGDTRIAYQVVGQGSIDLVFVPGFISNLELHWEDPGFAHLLKRLGTFARIIVFDKRGTGLSDRVDVRHPPSLETRMDDIRAVMDAAGSGRAALLGASEGAAMSLLFAATYPERTRALVLCGGYAHFQSCVMGSEAIEAFVQTIEKSWGSGAILSRFVPGRLSDERFRAWWARFERLSASPTAAVALVRMNAAIDVRHLLGSIRAPTLVLHRTEDVQVKLAGARYLASRIAGAKFVEVSGRDHPIWTGDIDRVVDEIEEFLTGIRPPPALDRVLATVLVARLIASARLSARLDERQWGERIDRLREIAARIIARYGGVVLGGGAEEIRARFDGPTRAVHCAVALRDCAKQLDLRLATGVHTGEVAVDGSSVSGLAVHIAERLSAIADTDVALVSGIVADLVAGGGVHFDVRGQEKIEGLREPIRVLAVVTEQHLEPATRGVRSASLDVLSSREREVLSLVADGMSNARVAQHLRLSEHTVKRHVANILLKLDLPTRAAAAAFAARERVS